MAGEIPVATATVSAQEGDHVSVSIPVAGFPPGFQLRPGERVVLATDDSGLVARPLVRTHVVGAGQRAAAATALQGAAVRSDVPASDRNPAGSEVVFEIDNGSQRGPARVVAVRNAR
jgi:hypothetical protein